MFKKKYEVVFEPNDNHYTPESIYHNMHGYVIFIIHARYLTA